VGSKQVEQAALFVAHVGQRSEQVVLGARVRKQIIVAVPVGEQFLRVI
jgi:hypothetical protein